MAKYEAKKWVKCKDFDGFPKQSDFTLETEQLEPIKDGEFLCEAVVLSVDPYMRLFGNTLPRGATLMGEQVARVTASKHADYPEGSYVCILAGWRTLTISDGTTPETRPLPELHGLPESLALGAVGMPATTAYFGLLDVAKLQDGETVFINGAAGAVGSTAGQIAKSKGCKVYGMAGTEAKITWLKNELGFDGVLNYKKTEDFKKDLAEMIPGGIDVFYDNVGSDLSVDVLSLMKAEGRVVVGGTMAGYNDKEGPGQTLGVLPWHHILMKTLTVRGFTLWQFWDRRPEAEKYLAEKIKEGSMKYEEKKFTGFENMPQAFMDMLKGDFMGKTVVYVK